MCPILNKDIPMIVYIKNRRLFRARRENRYAESSTEQVIEKPELNSVDVVQKQLLTSRKRTKSSNLSVKTGSEGDYYSCAEYLQ